MSTQAEMRLPQMMKKVVCHKLTSNFAEATKIVSGELPKPAAGQVLVRNKFVGINASDINFTAGRYFADAKLPFDTGFESVGDVVALGPNVSHVKVGQAVALMDFGAFAEYKIMEAAKVIPMPKVKAEYVPLLVSGLTASLALDKIGEIKKGDTVLVTAAAGGTGQFAVQWAKLKGAKRVLGTCSTDDKIEFLKKLGCDRPINYKKENLNDVLKKECPEGVDLVYESVGGDVFDTCVANLAKFGRLIIIGAISGYQSGQVGMSKGLSTMPIQLLTKSASVRGFFLFHFHDDVPEYLKQLVTLYETGKMQSLVDLGQSTGRPFAGVEDIGRAVDYMYSGTSIGKVLVELNQSSPETHL